MEGGCLAHRLVGMAWGTAGAPRPSPWVVHAVQRVDVKILALQVTWESGRPQVLTPHDPPPVQPTVGGALAPRLTLCTKHSAMPPALLLPSRSSSSSLWGRARVRPCSARTAPTTGDSVRLGAWWLPGFLKGMSRPKEGPSDGYMGDRKLLTLSLDSVPLLSLTSCQVA